MKGNALAFKPTLRKAEVLHRVATGKTNRDRADIFGSNPAAVESISRTGLPQASRPDPPPHVWR